MHESMSEWYEAQSEYRGWGYEPMRNPDRYATYGHRPGEVAPHGKGHDSRQVKKKRRTIRAMRRLKQAIAERC